MASSLAPSVDGDHPPPAKRRRLSKDGPQLPRGERALDLGDLHYQIEKGSLSENETFAYKSLLRSLRNKSKIVVIAGAGISVAAGIPDFRSSTGLFKTLKETHKLKGSGKQLFDASVYRDAQSTGNFHTMVRELSDLSKKAKPTAFHQFIAQLAQEKRLQRLYTQNVDGLETSLESLKTEVPLPLKAPWPLTVQLHGGLEKMVCTKCSHISDFDASLFDSAVPPSCHQCEIQDQIRTEHAGKRSHGIGRLRPRMVLYNEHNPDDEAIGSCVKADIRTRPDAVLVVGTSCKVPGVRRIVREMCQVVRNKRDGLAVWVNRDPVPSGKDLEDCWDIIAKGDADQVAQMVGLGHVDDALPHIDSLSEREVEKAKKQGQLQIMLNSPTKSPSKVVPARKNAPKTPPKTKNPASKGLKIDSFLKRTAGTTASTAPVAKTTSKTTTAQRKTAAQRPRKPATKAKFGKPATKGSKPTGPSIKLNFSTSKSGATPASTLEEKAQKSKPDAPSDVPIDNQPNLAPTSPGDVKMNGGAATAADAALKSKTTFTRSRAVKFTQKKLFQ